jgi:hypothetical protein
MDNDLKVKRFLASLIITHQHIFSKGSEWLVNNQVFRVFAPRASSEKGLDRCDQSQFKRHFSCGKVFFSILHMYIEFLLQRYTLLSRLYSLEPWESQGSFLSYNQIILLRIPLQSYIRIIKLLNLWYLK